MSDLEYVVLRLELPAGRRGRPMRRGRGRPEDFLPGGILEADEPPGKLLVETATLSERQATEEARDPNNAPLVGFFSCRATVSCPSERVSSRIGMSNVWMVTPSANVSVPVTAV